MILLPVLSAVLLVLSFPNPFSVFGLSPLSFVFGIPLFFALDRCSSMKQKFLAGAVFALTFYSLLIWWFFPYSPAGFLLFLTVLCLQPVCFSALFSTDYSPRAFSLLYLPSLWVASEALRETLMQGFSWGLGSALVFDRTLSAPVFWLGVPGASFLIILANVGLYRLLTQKVQRKSAVIVLAGLAVLFVGFRAGRLALRSPQRAIRILAVQPNINYRDKNNVEKAGENFDRQMDMTRRALRQDPAQLVVWPETAVTADVLQSGRMRQELRRLAEGNRTNILVGSAVERDGRNYNAAVLFTRDGKEKVVYDKRRLVPFTEYLPFPLLTARISGWLSGPAYDFAAGREPGVFDLPVWGGTVRTGVLICSEDTIGEMFEEYAQAGARLIVCLANDGWFAAREAKLLHAQCALSSSLTSRIPVLRVTNTGWTNYFDGRGGYQRETARIGRAGVLGYTVELPLPETFRVSGDKIVLISLCFVIMGQVLRLRKRNEKGKP